jgi:hypothetical protein
LELLRDLCPSKPAGTPLSMADLTVRLPRIDAVGWPA